MLDTPAKLHDWKIEPREYARQEERRGRRHAFESLDPTRTALVVIDMVPFFTGNAYCRGIIPNINRLATKLRAAGGTVAWVLPSDEQTHPALEREFYGEAVAELFRNSGGAGPLPARLAADLTQHAEDLFVEKQGPSAFFPGMSRLHDELCARQIDTALITGTVTNVCCESSARDARTRGYRVIMVADANAARRDADHNATLHTIYRTFGDVRPTDEVLALIGAGTVASVHSTG